MIFPVLCFVEGAAFIAWGIYFLSEKYTKKLNEACGQNEEEKKKIPFRVKTCAYTSLGVGALTICWGIFIIMFPQLMLPLAFTYMVFLTIVFLFLIIAFK